MQRGFLARIKEARLNVYNGNIVAAKSIVADVRASADISRELDLAGEIQIIEGLIFAGGSVWGSSIDRFRRGVVMGKMMRSSDISTFSEVWLSHCLLRLGRELEAIEILSRALIDISQARLEARHRFCVVVAELCAIAGERRCCEDWFEISRGLAGQVGARGLFSASLFNLCMLRVWHNALLPRLQNRLDSECLQADLKLLESSINYDKLANVSDRRFLHELLRGQLVGMLGKVEDAKFIFQSLLESGVVTGELEIHRIRLENIWFSLDASLSSVSLRAFCELLNGSVSLLNDEDDLALANSLLAKCHELLGDREKSLQAQNEADRLIDALRKKQELLKSRLASLRFLDVNDFRSIVG